MMGRIGDIRKIVVHDGHNGPKEINVQPEFLNWLVDPKLNGGGALFDFGCYGADLATWLMDGQRPLSVTAVTQQLKPEIYRTCRRRSHDCADVSPCAGDHPGIVELARGPQRHGSLRPERIRDYGQA